MICKEPSPWIVQVILSAFNEKDLEIMIKVGQSPSDDAPARPSTAHNYIDLERLRSQALWNIDAKHTSSGIVILHRAQGILVRKFR